MIIDIRGTNGSGKSWIVHQLLGNYKHQVIKDNDYTLGYYIHQFNCAIVGRYDTTCGGCDGLGTPDRICDRVRDFNRQYHNVILEGLTVSHTYKRYSDLAFELGNYVFAYLNTPVATCINRVIKRRELANNTKPFDPTNLLLDFHKTWLTARVKHIKAGNKVIELDWHDPLPQVLGLLNGKV